MVNIIHQNFEENKKIYCEKELELRGILGDNVPINHIGSTAIPNIDGKNIIDILVGAKDDTQFKEFFIRISNMGYLPSVNSRTDIYQFFASRTGETGSGDTHIHLVLMNTERYDEFIILRDYLLSNPDEAIKYSDYKKEILSRGIVERKQYKATKSEYVTALIERAKEFYNYKKK